MIPDSSVGLLGDESSMTLSTLLTLYLGEREPSPRYVESLRRTVRKAAIYGLDSVCQLDPARVNDFLRRLDLSPATRANIRRELLTLWRFAFERTYTDIPPLRVMRIKQHRPAPRAWDYETLKRLLGAAEADTRPVSQRWRNLRWQHILPAWIAIGFDTGLRFTDILHLRQCDVVNGCVCIVANKTGKPTVRKLSEYSWRHIQWLSENSSDGTVFRWCMTRRRMLLKWRSFLDELRLPGSSRWLRRSAATFVERNAPGSAQAFLSHSQPNLSRMHYIDQTLLDVPRGPKPLRD